MAGEVKIAIVGDAAQLRRVLSEVGDDLDKQGKKTEDAGRKMQAAGVVSMAAGGLMFAAMSRAASTASDLNEAVNQTDVIFGSASESVSKFAENSVSIGMSERAARDATGQFGLLFKNVGQTAEASAGMSIELTKLTADAASFKNTTPEEAVAAFGSALRGESEPIRQYGIMLDEAAVKNKALELGLVSGSGELDNAAKVQARYALIVEQSAAFTGDFANTSDSLANQQRVTAAETENAAAKMGAGFVPIMEKAHAVVQSAAGAFGSLDEITGGMASNAAIAGAGVLVLGGALSTVVGSAVRMREAWTTLTATMAAARAAIAANTVALGAAGAALGVATLAVVAGVMAWQSYASTKAEAKRVTDLMVDALKQERDGIDGVSEALARKELADSAAGDALADHAANMGVLIDGLRNQGSVMEVLDDNLIDLTADMSGMSRENKTAAQVLRESGVATSAFTDELVRLIDTEGLSAQQKKDLINALDGVSDRYDDAAKKLATTTALTGESTDKTKAATSATLSAADAAANATAGNYALGGSYRFAGDAAYEAYNSTWNYADALDKAYDAAFASSNAADDFARATDFSTKATKSGGGAMRDAAKDAQRLEDAQRGVTEAEVELADAVLKRFLVQLGPSENQVAIAEIEARQRKRALAQATDEVREAEEALIAAQKSNDGAAIAAAIAAQERNVAEAKRNVERAELRVIQAQERLTKAREDGDPAKITQAELDLADAQDDVKDATDKSKTASDGLSTAQDLQEAAARDTEKASRDLEAAHDDVTLAEIDAKQAEQELTDTRNIGKEGSKELRAANDEVEAANRRVRDATNALRDAETEMSGARSGGGGSIETTKSLSEQLQIVEDRGRAWIKSLQDHGAPAAEVDAALDTIRARMQEISDREPGHEEVLERYWATFDQNAGNARDTLQEVLDKMNEINILLAIDPTLVGNKGNTSSSVRGYASGTTSAAAGLAVVGEDGPELVNFRGGETVYPNGTGPGGTGSGGMSLVFNFNAPVTRADASHIGDSVQRALMGSRLRVALAGA